MAQMTFRRRILLASPRAALAANLGIALCLLLPVAAQAGTPTLDDANRLAWAGDYAAAMAVLEQLPDDDAVRAARARVLAWADHRHAALALIDPLRAAHPGDPGLAWTEALAWSKSARPERALPALSIVQTDAPGQADTRTLALAVRRSLFSSAGLGAGDYDDSDDIRRHATGVSGDLRVSDPLRLLFEFGRVRHSAPASGPFAPIGVGGADSTTEQRAQIGVAWALDPDTRLSAMLGSSRVDGLGSTGIGNIRLQRDASDMFGWQLGVDRDRVNASPRSLGVIADTASASARYRPTLRDQFDVQASVGDFDDDNRRSTMLGSWRHATWRSERVMLDLGVGGEWQHNSRNTGNGYYSPDNYRRIAPFASVYINLGAEAGLYLAAASGVQRDETFSGWKRATDLDAELTVGIYSHWQLVARAAYSERLNQLGAYHGTTLSLNLRYRFCEFRADRCPQP